MQNKKKLFILGDSILIYYRVYLKRFLENKFYIYTKIGYREAFKNLDFPCGMNTGDSRMTLNYLLNEENKNNIYYNYFVFNCGLHDIKREVNTNTIQIKLTEYKYNLSKIIEIMKRNDVYTIFINTTPVVDEIHNKKESLTKRFHQDEVEYNRIAESVMKNNNIPVIDLNSFTKNIDGIIYKDHVHFNADTAKLQAAYIAGAINTLI